MGVNDYIQIGSRIKEARIAAKLQQKEVAKILKIPVSTYSGYENNHREPNTETLGRIAEALGVSVDWLIYGKKGFTFREHKEEVTPEEAIKKIKKIGEDLQGVFSAAEIGSIMQSLGEQFKSTTEDILTPYSQLNEKGKRKAVEYTNDLTQIEKYTKKEEE